MHTTNYYNTFIEVAEDCPVSEAAIPVAQGENKTIPAMQYEMISENPYRYTSDDIIFKIQALRKGLDPHSSRERELFYSKGQPCLRCSPLGKRYGWGIHSDADGKVALYAVGSEEYERFKSDQSLDHVKAMRSKRKK